MYFCFMPNNIDFYTTVDSMEPLFPDDASRELEALAIELIEKAGKLSGVLNPITRVALGDFLRPMNSYYSNLIEGHDAHPLDIERALNNDFSKDKINRDLQKEALAHINLHKYITEKYASGVEIRNPASGEFLKEIHKKFYDHLPEEFKFAKSKDNKKLKVTPGEFRKAEVEVVKHIAPFSASIDLFAHRFQNFYNPTNANNKSKIKRIISIAASHHRLAWIHPFLDGNGRVVRLFSDACFMYEGLDAFGLWSISRGLARSNNNYKSHLANADQIKLNNYDGRGNLSNKYLIEFCGYFLKVAIDQITFMTKVIDAETMANRLDAFGELMALRNYFKPEAKYILTELFLKGKISKSDAMRITNTSDKTIKIIAESLIKLELLYTKKEGIHMMYYAKYPIRFSPLLFPGLYPCDKEIDMMNII